MQVCYGHARSEECFCSRNAIINVMQEGRSGGRHMHPVLADAVARQTTDARVMIEYVDCTLLLLTDSHAPCAHAYRLQTARV
jgi:hypothetical protein